ncbi:MAG TPA: tail fiber domain-containing protein [Flavobacteriales bacterium]|nr:tail fiber domain-containing protein [Flavobacteriales bacterium]
MKKKIILGSVLAFTMAATAEAQWSGGNPEVQNGSALIGATGTPANQLEVKTGTSGDGIRVTKTGSSGSCALLLNNTTPNGNMWTLSSQGTSDSSPGGLSILSSSQSNPDMLIETNGVIRMGGNVYSSPILQISRSGNNAGVGATNALAKFTSVSNGFQFGGLFQSDPTGDNGTWEGVGCSSVNSGGYTGTFIGFEGYATSSSSASGRTTKGIYGTGSGGYTNYGAHLVSSGGNTAYGVYASASGATTNWAGYFAGSTYSTGTYQGSDKRFKKNIQKFESASAKLQKLNGYTYTFNAAAFKERNFESTEQIGLIAQEVQEVFPQLVKDDGSGYLAVNYTGLIPVMLEGFKEQQATIEAQQKQIDELKSLVQSLATNNNGIKNNAQAITFTDKNSVILDQNMPNPFAESTVITYSLPAEFGKAQILFHTADGKIIRAVDVNPKGIGQLTVFANDLTTGTYTYTLVVDGKIIDTKRMVKQ